MEVIIDIFTKIGDGIKTITVLINSFFDFFKNLIAMIPYPFDDILKSVILIVIAVITVRIITG